MADFQTFHILKDAEGGIWAVLANVDNQAVQQAIDEATATMLAAAATVEGGLRFTDDLKSTAEIATELLVQRGATRIDVRIWSTAQ